MKITAHTLVKNEQRWVWFALMSVLDQVDELMVWDTGSIDDTVAVIKSIRSPKIKFHRVRVITPEDHTAARQQMLDRTDADWILILDGDEIWWQASLTQSLAAIRRHPDLSALVSRFINCVGDIHHFQPPADSRYEIAGVRGPYNLRFINRRTPGLHVAKPHGGQEYRDSHEIPLQSFPAAKLKFVSAPYLHTTHLLRSGTLPGDRSTLKRGFKFRYQLGRTFPPDFVYPEVFYLSRPEIVPDPWTRRSAAYIAKSLLYEPVRSLKKILVKKKEGY